MWGRSKKYWINARLNQQITTDALMGSFVAVCHAGRPLSGCSWVTNPTNHTSAGRAVPDLAGDNASANTNANSYQRSALPKISKVNKGLTRESTASRCPTIHPNPSFPPIFTRAAGVHIHVPYSIFPIPHSMYICTFVHLHIINPTNYALHFLGRFIHSAVMLACLAYLLPAGLDLDLMVSVHDVPLV